MNTIDLQKLPSDYERDGVVRIPQFLGADEVAAVRTELDRYIRDDLEAQPVDARMRGSNLPRHPLVFGEVDRKTLQLIRNSVVTLDQEDPADKKQGRLDLSHFHLLEDRVSQEILVTYPRNHNRYKSREHVPLRLALP